MQDALGQEEYKKAFQEKLQGVYDSGVDLKIEAEERKLEKTGDGVAVKDKSCLLYTSASGSATAASAAAQSTVQIRYVCIVLSMIPIVALCPFWLLYTSRCV